MNSNQSTISSQPEEDIDEFLYDGARKFSSESVIKWGPKDDTDNFLQQTVNCLDACKMAIQCTFSGMSQQSMQAEWDQISASHENHRSLKSDFVHTQDCKMKAKSAESKDMTSQQFWMFRRDNRKEIYVVFSSQETSAYILSDADIWKMPTKKATASVDDIPISLFKGLLSQNYVLVFTGHSLGGAIAILATYKLLMKDLDDTQINKIRCITFGAPLVSHVNWNLGEMLNLNKIIFRYELPEDPVPQLLTAFQRGENPYQEFLVNLMNFLGLQNSFDLSNDVDFGLKDFLELSKSSLDEIKRSGSKLGTVFVPQSKINVLTDLHFTQYYMNPYQEWKYLQNLNLDGSQSYTKLFLSEFIEKLKTQHKFERYKQELSNERLHRIHLPKRVGLIKRFSERIQCRDMVQFRIPINARWTCNPSSLDHHPNQVQAFFDKKFTKVIVKSKYPHVLGIRYGEIQQYPQWGIEASQILQDWGDCNKIMFNFYSADNYKDIKNNSLLQIKFYGYFETIQNIQVEAKQLGEDVWQIRSSAYENINLQQLYNSAFQACLFAGEGHNPMLQAQNQSVNKRSTLLQQDHNSLVELLGSLIVNQECLEIILNENQKQIIPNFQTKWAQEQQFDTCDKKIILNNVKVEENKEKLVVLAKKNLSEIYNRFKLDTEQLVTSTANQHQDAKDCVKDSIPTLFSLSCSLIWQMKMILWGAGGVGAAAKVGAAGGAAAAGGLAATGAAATAVGVVALITVGLGAFIYSLSRTGVEFKNFFHNSQEMQKQYKVQLVALLKALRCELNGVHSVAVLEKEITELCQSWLQQDKIDYKYNNSEKELNQKILEYILEANDSEESGTKEELKKLISRKVDYLSKHDCFQGEYEINAHRLAALLLFIWNNYRIRFQLTKALRIGVMGAKNAGKSTLCKLLGGAIQSTGENSSTDDATLYQNVPANGLCVVDFPHLDLSCPKANNTMKMFYSLSDITIIVMKSQDRGDQLKQNQEAVEVIQTVQMKYSQMGFENIKRRLPVLLLFNQVDKMVFNEDGVNHPDEVLSRIFKKQKEDIINKFKQDYKIDEKKVYFVFASINPKLPKKESQERVRQLTLELQNQFLTKQISAEEFAQNTLEIMDRGNSIDKKRLQNITGCSFYRSESQSIISILAKIVEDLGDQQVADSIIASQTISEQTTDEFIPNS